MRYSAWVWASWWRTRPHIAAIDQGDRAGEHVLRPHGGAVLGKLVADQFRDQLGARGQAALLHHHVKLAEELGRQAHAEPGQVGRRGVVHGFNPQSYY